MYICVSEMFNGHNQIHTAQINGRFEKGLTGRVLHIWHYTQLIGACQHFFFNICISEVTIVCHYDPCDMTYLTLLGEE